jgi:hypothetical protein
VESADASLDAMPNIVTINAGNTIGCTIEVRFGALGPEHHIPAWVGTVYHAYIVVTDDLSKQMYGIRGEPSHQPNPPPSSGVAALSADYGPLTFLDGPYSQNTGVDGQGVDNDSKNTDPRYTVFHAEMDFDLVEEHFHNIGNELKNKKYKYIPLQNNSNDFASALLKMAGITPPANTPNGINAPAWNFPLQPIYEK